MGKPNRSLSIIEKTVMNIWLEVKEGSSDVRTGMLWEWKKAAQVVRKELTLGGFPSPSYNFSTTAL